MPDETDIPIFYGSSRHAVDESRRVMIPVKWRPKDPGVEFSVLAWPLDNEDYLLVMPPERWRAMLERLKGNSLHDQSLAVLERAVGSKLAPLALGPGGPVSLAVNPGKLGR